MYLILSSIDPKILLRIRCGIREEVTVPRPTAISEHKGAANPVPGSNDIAADNVTLVSAMVPNLLEKREGCSGDRNSTNVCRGKKLAKQYSFHNW